MKLTSLLPLPVELSTWRSSSADRQDAREGVLLGVDGGATKTVAQVLNPFTGLLTEGTAGPSNADAVGVSSAQDALSIAVQAAFRPHKDTLPIISAVLALAGSRAGEVALGADASIVDAQARSLVVNDVVAAWAAGTLATPGVALIAGTGSNCFGVGELGDTWRSGGWGHKWGDEGSAYWLGHQAIRAALKYRDARQHWSAVVDSVIEVLDIKDPAEIFDLPETELAKDRVATLAPYVLQAHQTGDSVAQRIVDQALDDLVTHVVAIRDHIRVPDPLAVAVSGGLFNAEQEFRAPFERKLTSAIPNARVVIPPLTPVAGALWLAARLNFGGDALPIDLFAR